MTITSNLSCNLFKQKRKKAKNMEVIDISDEEEELPEQVVEPPVKKWKKDKPLGLYDFSSDEDEEMPDNVVGPPVVFKENNVPEDLRFFDEVPKTKGKGKKSDPSKEAEKIKKQEERTRKKDEAEKEKVKKREIAQGLKNMKRDECLKFIIAHLDQQLKGQDFGNEITKNLESESVDFKIVEQIFPNTITWTRKAQSHLVEQNGQLALSSDEKDTNEIVLVLNWKEFLDHVKDGSLTGHIQFLNSVLKDKRFILAIYGMEKYFNYQKSLRNSELRAEVTQNTASVSKKSKEFADAPRISRGNIEEALTELQLFQGVSYRMVENGAELGLLVYQITKSIAEQPYKEHKKDNVVFAGDNRDCVRVDPSGNGLKRLWNQTLTTFQLAGLETAEAISALYPTPSALLDAYDQCLSQDEGEKLLQDIPIRRAAGPLTNSRKIGPELSRKMYTFFNSLNGDLQI